LLVSISYSIDKYGIFITAFNASISTFNTSSFHVYQIRDGIKKKKKNSCAKGRTRGEEITNARPVVGRRNEL